METSELFLPALVLGIAIVMLALGLSNRVIAKLGLRNFYRHKGHAVISIAGLLVGTSIICASMVVGDSIEYFIVEETYNDLQHIDMVVSGENGAEFNYSIFTVLESDQSLAGLIDGISPLLVESATVRHTGTMLFEPTANIIGFEHGNDYGFGNFTLLDGSQITGEGLGPDQAMINQALADNLGAVEGDVLALTYSVGTYPMSATVGRNISISHILADEGKARFNPNSGLSFETYNIFMGLDSVQSMFLKPNMISHVKISNIGGIEDGTKGSEESEVAIESALQGLAFEASDMMPVFMANQTFAQLSNINVAPESFTIFLNGTPMPATDFVLNSNSGMVYFLAPLQFGDILTATYEFSYSLEVDAVKQDSLDAAKMINDLISTFLTIFGSFAIIAGVILIINIFTMLAEERKSELGMARAVGMKRRHLMQSFLFEGVAYGSIASAMGTLLGVGVGVGLIFMVNNFMDFLGIVLPIHFELFSLLSAFSLGFIITFGTILLTSWKISKLNIMQAIRGIQEPAKDRKALVLPLFGALLAAAGCISYYLYPDDLVVKLIAPSGIIAGIAMILWRWIGNRAAITSASLGVFIYTYYGIRTYFGDMESNSMDFLFVFSGVLIVLSIVLLIMYNSGPLIMAITGTFGRVKAWRPTIMTAVSYPLTKKFRTGMSVGMFALVVYMIVMLSVFSNMFVIDVEEETIKQGGGFEIIADVQYPVPDLNSAIDPLSNATIVSQALGNNITRHTNIMWTYSPKLNNTDVSAPSFGFGDNNMFSGSQVLGIDASFHTDATFEFTNTLDEFPTDRDVWSAVTAPGSGDVVVSSIYSMFMNIQPGNHITVDNILGFTSREFRVIGILDNSMMQIMGVFMSKENLAQSLQFPMMPSELNKNVFMFDLKEGYDAEATARALERDFAAVGMNTIIIRDVAQTTLETTSSIFVLFELYLDMGLIVGVAGLGIITIRSVVERTPEIGILRSLGFKRKNVRNAFLIEILFVATMGVLIGIVSGVMVSYEIFNVMISGFGGDIEFVIPWMKIAYVTAIAYLATIICTIVPAHNASKISPAEALRYVG
ncbi:MAG: FtsX-like permease family protein [Thermoplasmata archaeon]